MGGEGKEEDKVRGGEGEGEGRRRRRKERRSSHIVVVAIFLLCFVSTDVSVVDTLKGFVCTGASCRSPAAGSQPTPLTTEDASLPLDYEDENRGVKKRRRKRRQTMRSRRKKRRRRRQTMRRKRRRKR